MAIDITDVELSNLFGHLRGWAQGMVSRYLRQLQTESPAPRRRPKLLGSGGEVKLNEFCFRRQLERDPGTIDDAFEFMREAEKQFDRFGVCRFVERNTAKPKVHEVVLMEKEWREVSRTTWSAISKQLT
jgi:hypothetical protein